MDDVQKKIADDVTKNPIVIYAKGIKGQPQCGFSAAVMEIFDNLGAKYEVRNVLADPAIRDGIKQFTNWPTIPQIFISGQFVGGCDIVRELYQNGELATMVKSASEGK